MFCYFFSSFTVTMTYVSELAIICRVSQLTYLSCVHTYCMYHSDESNMPQLISTYLQIRYRTLTYPFSLSPPLHKPKQK